MNITFDEKHQLFSIDTESTSYVIGLVTADI